MEEKDKENLEQPTQPVPQEQPLDPYQQQIKLSNEAHDKLRKTTEEAANKEIGGYNTLISEVEGKQRALREQDETAIKKENAYKYITGLGDTLSSIANLVGVAEFDAANQQQTYGSSKLMEKAEAARKQRKLSIDQLSNRLTELTSRRAALEKARDKELGKIDASKASEEMGILAKQREDQLALEKIEATYKEKSALQGQKAEENLALQEEKNKGSLSVQEEKNKGSLAVEQEKSANKQPSKADIDAVVLAAIEADVKAMKENSALTQGENYTREEVEEYLKILEDIESPNAGIRGAAENRLKHWKEVQGTKDYVKKHFEGQGKKLSRFK